MSGMSTFDEIIRRFCHSEEEYQLLTYEVHSLWNDPDYDVEPSPKAMRVFEVWEEENAVSRY